MKRVWAAIPVGVICACLVLSLALWAQASGRPRPATDPEPRTGMDLLQAYRCHKAETKHVILRGVEDGFSIAGNEPASIRDSRRTPRTLSISNLGGYDGTEPDRWLIDHLNSPARVSRGLFVISLKPLAENGNDVITIGDMTDVRSSRLFFSGTPQTLGTAPGWRSMGPVHYAELDQIRLVGSQGRLNPYKFDGPTQVLLDYVRGGGDETVIDVQVLDDTSVDFIGLAVCEQPTAGKGVTYTKQFDLPVGFAALSCWNVPEGDRTCDPFKGDTPCTTALPVACHRDRGEPVPVKYRRSSNWSGGEMAFTTPTPASRFRTVGEVDAFCRAQFGQDWRIVRYHEGGIGGELLARSRTRAPSSRVWVDIQDQPYATCWARR